MGHGAAVGPCAGGPDLQVECGPNMAPARCFGTAVAAFALPDGVAGRLIVAARSMRQNAGDGNCVGPKAPRGLMGRHIGDAGKRTGHPVSVGAGQAPHPLRRGRRRAFGAWQDA